MLFHFIVRFEQRQRCLADIWLPRSLHYRMRGKKEEMEGGRGASLPPVICISRSGSAPNPPSASNQKDSRGGGKTNNTLQQCAPYAWHCQTNLDMTEKRLLVCRCCWVNCASRFGYVKPLHKPGASPRIHSFTAAVVCSMDYCGPVNGSRHVK